MIWNNHLSHKVNNHISVSPSTDLIFPNAFITVSNCNHWHYMQAEFLCVLLFHKSHVALLTSDRRRKKMLWIFMFAIMEYSNERLRDRLKVVTLFCSSTLWSPILFHSLNLEIFRSWLTWQNRENKNVFRVFALALWMYYLWGVCKYVTPPLLYPVYFKAYLAWVSFSSGISIVASTLVPTTIRTPLVSLKLTILK